MRQYGMPGLALLVLVGCSGVGFTSPREITANLAGDWAETARGPGRLFTDFTLTVSDTVVQGAGFWFDDAGGFGHSIVTGFVSGPQIALRIAQDNGMTFRYDAQMLSHTLLSGEFTYNGTRVAANYERATGHAQPE